MRKLVSPAALGGACVLLLCVASLVASGQQKRPVDIAAIDRGRILTAADHLMSEAPLTVTAFSSPRSAGGIHEYFSEGDYWWHDPKNPEGPYVQRDGMTNPANFNKHRELLRRMCDIVSNLAAAYKVTRD